MPGISKTAVIDSVLKGLKTAQQTYENWSHSWLNESGVESLVTTTIAGYVIDAMRESGKDRYLTLEEPFWNIADATGAAAKRGPLPTPLKGRKRADIVLWSDWVTVWGVIEVKRKLEWKGFDADWDRLRALMDRYGPAQDGSLRLAALAVPFSCAADDDFKKIKARYGEIRKYLADYEDRAVVHEVEPYCSEVWKNRGRNAVYSHGGVLIDYQSR